MERILSYKDAIKEALDTIMENDPECILFGEGVNDKEGIFGTTVGLCEKYGIERVFDVPLSETGITGVAVGAALAGIRSIYCHNRPDFLYLAMDQLINHAAKYRYMSGGQCRVPLLIWAATGQGWGSAAQHAQELHGMFMQVPGLKIISPTTPYDVKGMLISAAQEEDPVLFLDHRRLYAGNSPVPDGSYTVPIGVACIRREGTDLTIVTASSMVPEALKVCQELEEDKGITVELVDIRSIKPLDIDTIIRSARKTGRVLVVDNASPMGGLGAELSAMISERAFSDLKCPVKRLSYPDTPVPAAYALEDEYYINSERILDSALSIMERE